MSAAPPHKTQRTCSQCGNNGHNARTCVEQQQQQLTVASCSSNNSNGVMLFGVRLTPSVESLSNPLTTVSPTVSNNIGFRKCMSMNNLAQYQQQRQQQQQQNCLDDSSNGRNGYASDDALHASGSRNRERKKGVAWTEEEHRLFIRGLNKVGKGDWKGIARNFVKTRSPTQVASHAQKYFLRKTNNNRRRRRSSLFDITTDAITRSLSDSQLHIRDTPSLPPKPIIAKPTTLNPSNTIPLMAPSSKLANLNLNESPTYLSPPSSTSTNGSTREFDPLLSLKLTQASPSDEESSKRSNGFGVFNSNGDSIITVA